MACSDVGNLCVLVGLKRNNKKISVDLIRNCTESLKD